MTDLVDIGWRPRRGPVSFTLPRLHDTRQQHRPGAEHLVIDHEDEETLIPKGLCERCEAFDVVERITNHVNRLRSSVYVSGPRGSLDSLATIGKPVHWDITTCCLCRLFFDACATALPQDTHLSSVGTRSWHHFDFVIESTIDSDESSPNFYLKSESLKKEPSMKSVTMSVLSNRLHNKMDIKVEQEASILYGRPNTPYMRRAREIDQASVSYDLIADWLHICEHQHTQECGLKSQQYIHGLWLIDCSNPAVVRAPIGARYVALSYVWGDVHTTSIPDGSTPFTTNTLPRSIKDAMAVTRALGLKYLWVDKYCIRSTDATHLVQQIRQMHKIYEQSHLTIIAAAGADSDSGLPGVGGGLRSRQHLAQVGTSLLLSSLPDIKLDLTDTPWSKRGWTLQEGALSRRRLIFTKRQVYFECQQSHACESLLDTALCTKTTAGAFWPPDVSRYFPPGPMGEFEFFDSARKIGKSLPFLIDAYLQRDLTYESDILHAFTGILEKYRETTLLQFYWGMPYTEQDSARALLTAIWGLNNRGHPRRRPGFPSWSWVAWKGGSMDIDERETLHMCSISVELSSGDIVPWETYTSVIQHPSPYLHVDGIALTITPRTLERGVKYSRYLSLCSSGWCVFGASVKPWMSRREERQKVFADKIWQGVAFLTNDSDDYSRSPGRVQVRFLVLEAQGAHYRVVGSGMSLETVPVDMVVLCRQRSFRIG